jgi:hypothetical protein
MVVTISSNRSRTLSRSIGSTATVAAKCAMRQASMRSFLIGEIAFEKSRTRLGLTMRG